MIQENDEPPKSYIHVRGDWQDHGPEVQPGTPSLLPPLPAGAKPDRLALAQWMVSRGQSAHRARGGESHVAGAVRPRHRAHLRRFRHGGRQPSHPELLDWLAVGIRGARLGLKQMIRLMVTSATYRQSSNARPELIDARSRELAAGAADRAASAGGADSRLGAGRRGLLNPAVGGKSVRPPQPAGVAELTYNESGNGRRARARTVTAAASTSISSAPSPYPATDDLRRAGRDLSCSRRAAFEHAAAGAQPADDPVFFEAAQALA